MDNITFQTLQKESAELQKWFATQIQPHQVALILHARETGTSILIDKTCKSPIIQTNDQFNFMVEQFAPFNTNCHRHNRFCYIFGLQISIQK